MWANKHYGVLEHPSQSSSHLDGAEESEVVVAVYAAEGERDVAVAAQNNEHEAQDEHHEWEEEVVGDQEERARPDDGE